MKKNFLEWIAYILLFVWQILQNVSGLLMWLYFKFRGHVETIVKNKYSRVYKSRYMRGGISLGCFAFVSDISAERPTMVLHEQGHMWDSKVMGPLYLVIVGVPSILNAIFHFTKCYYFWPPEVWANKHAGVGVDSSCRLYIKEKGAR